MDLIDNMEVKVVIPRWAIPLLGKEKAADDEDDYHPSARNTWPPTFLQRKCSGNYQNTFQGCPARHQNTSTATRVENNNKDPATSMKPDELVFLDWGYYDLKYH
uniref:Uncharacterized protein n=1 Tax=Ditylum brightwellii TaxID=49249 RepID=A0A7S1Z960_9STRA|mmetsp:Transcript_26887/g.39954  ORF Transcript_26887/g.39954 Transcript_26887/m.39954 type:complete len:104 (+) Transcript_26887:267-578(+)